MAKRVIFAVTGLLALVAAAGTALELHADTFHALIVAGSGLVGLRFLWLAGQSESPRLSQFFNMWS